MHLQRIPRVERLQIKHCPSTFAYSISLPLPTFERLRKNPSGLRRHHHFAALRRCTTAWMITTLQTVSAAKHFVQLDNIFVRGLNAQRLPPPDGNPLPPEKFRGAYNSSTSFPTPFLLVPKFEFRSSRNKFFDLTAARIPMIIIRTSLLWRADKLAHWEIPNAGCMDGAKIYFCYRRCCFLTRKGSCSFLHRLSPRKSRL